MTVREDEVYMASAKRVDVPGRLISRGRGAAVMTHSDGGQRDDVIRAADGLADADVCQASDCADVPGRYIVHRDAREIAEDEHLCQPSCPGLLGLCRECTVCRNHPYGDCIQKQRADSPPKASILLAPLHTQTVCP